MRKKERRKERGIGGIIYPQRRAKWQKIVQFIEWVNSAFREPAIVTVTTVHSMNET